MDINELLEQHKLSNYWDKFDESGNYDLKEIPTKIPTKQKNQEDF